MSLPAGTWAIALGVFGACVVAAAAVAGWPGAGGIVGVVAMPITAALAALVVARLTRLDRAISRAAFCQARDPQDVIDDVVACAEAVRRIGPAGLPHLASDQKDPLLADGLRLIAIGATSEVLRDALERRMEAGAARAFVRLRAVRWVCATAPIVALPSIGLCAVWMLSVGSAPAGVAPTAAAVGVLVLLPMIAFAALARPAPSVSEGVLHATLVIEGLSGMRAGQSPASIREHLCRLLPGTAIKEIAAIAA